MAQRPHGKLSRPGSDFLTEELAVALSGQGSFEFKPLFTLVYAKLRASNRANGGEEMLRLRVYEKLQALVDKGMVSRVLTRGVKEYGALASLVAALPRLPIAEVAS